MLGLCIALIVIGVTGYAIFKNYKAQTVLFAGGLIMMAIAVLLGFGPKILPAKQSTGLVWFDMIKFIEIKLSSRAAGLGLLIMAVTGFARYMDKIGASRVLVSICTKPLKFFKSPYLVLALGFIIGQLMHMVIPSASGLGVLLMVTMYPILISAGASRTSATAVIGTNSCLDLGPASGNTVLAAKTAGLNAVDYFVRYQLPVALAITLAVAVVHYFVQRWFDSKYEDNVSPEMPLAQAAASKEEDMPPTWYALLPVVPLVLILLFGYFKIYKVHMEIVSCMLLSLIIGMIFEYIRIRDLKKVFAGIQSFFDGMGKQFAVVVTLIVAGETFAYGLTKLGAIDTLIGAAQSAGFGKTAMILVMSGIIAFCTVVMGSGNAPFFAFAAFAPEVAKKAGFDAVNLLLPMQLSASVARSMSPITAVIVAICGISGVSPFEVIKRTAIPMGVGLVLVQVVTFVMFG